VSVAVVSAISDNVCVVTSTYVPMVVPGTAGSWLKKAGGEGRCNFPKDS